MSLTEVASWSAPDYWRIDTILIPFASTAGGDKWCWYPTWTRDEEAGIVLALHDRTKATLYAPSLESFLFRQLLEACLRIDDGTLELNDLSIDEFRQTLRANITTLEPYLRARWIQILRTIVERDFVANHEKIGRIDDIYQSLLLGPECDALLSAELQSPRLGETFNHMTS